MDMSNCIIDDMKHPTMLILGRNQLIFVLMISPYFFTFGLIFMITQIMQKRHLIYLIKE